jgi:hypothetical protein
LDPKSRWVSDRIASIYLEGLSRAHYHPVILLPRGCFRTTAPGDSPFDHRLPSDAPVPKAYRNKIRRASGAIERLYPVGLDVTLEEAVEARRAAQRAAADRYKIATCPAPDTDWLGF